MSDIAVEPLSKVVLAEQWFSLLQGVLSALQSAFRASGYTKEMIAKRVGKDPATINRCLRGRRNMTLRTMHELARAMNCRLRIELDPLDSLTPTNNRPGPARTSSGTALGTVTKSSNIASWDNNAVPAAPIGLLS